MRKGERGFTLVELVVVIAISGFIFSLLGTGIYQLVTVPEQGNDRVTALHELQQVAHRVNIDGQMAQTATGGGQLSLSFPDSSSANYTLAGTVLFRTTSTSNHTLAQNITSASFSVQDRMITMNLTSAPAGRWSVSENETYKIYLRPSEG